VALEGSLQDFSLSDVFRLLDSGAKSGTINLESGDARGMVCFRDGRIYFAASSWQRDPLGRRMVRAGLITEKQLRQALGLMKIQKKEKAGRRLGQVLVDEGYIDARALEQFVNDALFDTLFDLFRWDEGALRFEQTDSGEEQDIGVSVAVDLAIQEMTRRLEQWERIRERVPNLDTVFVMADAPGDKPIEIHLKPAEWLLLTHLHGGSTVRELMEATGGSDFEIARALYAMQAAGLIERVGDGSLA
jgi:hypothetical protein